MVHSSLGCEFAETQPKNPPESLDLSLLPWLSKKEHLDSSEVVQKVNECTNVVMLKLFQHLFSWLSSDPETSPASAGWCRRRSFGVTVCDLFGQPSTEI